MDNKIIDHLASPHELERLYRNSPKDFEIWLADATSQNPDSEVLMAWNARLDYSTQEQRPADSRKLYLVVGISFIAFLFAKIPALFSVSENWYYPRAASILVFGSLAAYFLAQTSLREKITRVAIGGIGFCTLIAFLLPDAENSSSVIMSLIHLPLVLGSILALAYIGDHWRDAAARLEYIRFLGEIFIYTTLIFLGGMVLTGVSIQLFALIGINIEDWYMMNVAMWGALAAPLVATYIYDSVLGRQSKLATIIANVFSPLFLITVVVYLLAMVYARMSPYVDRNFLITFNGLLILVWGITIYSVAGRHISPSSKFSDKVTIGLVATTLIINAVALSAIVFRLAEYGLSPNRVAVTGSNILIFVHLVMILIAYLKEIRGDAEPEGLTKVVSDYLPVYTGWAVFIFVGLPLLFWFK